MDQARDLLDSQSLSLTQLADRIGLSPAYLQKRFKQHFGMSPAEYLRQRKLGRFKTALRGGSDVTSALYDVGFGSPSRIYEHSDTRLGMPPAVYGRGGQGMRISFSLLDTALGRSLIAATERGVCAIYLGDGDDALRGMLADEFPQASLSEVEDGRDEFLAPRVRAVADALAGKRASLRLELIGSAFQHQVWEALMRLPSGETFSYAELATRIGRSSATRAVASACGRNKLAVLVPCHRIVRGDGSLGGYRWGLPMKRQLLEREAG